MWTYALIRSKKAIFICLANDESCKFNLRQHQFVRSILGRNKNLLEGVYQLPLSFDTKILTQNKITPEIGGKASKILQYSLESGYFHD